MDTWVSPHLFRMHMSTGAPPDAFCMVFIIVSFLVLQKMCSGRWAKLGLPNICLGCNGKGQLCLVAGSFGSNGEIFPCVSLPYYCSGDFDYEKIPNRSHIRIFPYLGDSGKLRVGVVGTFQSLNPVVEE